VFTANTWTAVDVTPVVRGNGPLALAMVGRGATQLSYRSRETSTAPRLVIKTATSVTTTTTTTTTPPVTGPGTTSTTVTGAAPPPYRYMYDHDGSPSGYDRIADAGFNLVDVGPYASSLDALAPLKVKGLVWLGDYDNATCSWERSDSTIRSQVSAVKGHPNVAGYLISDEPQLSACPNAPAQHKARSLLVKPGSTVSVSAWLVLAELTRGGWRAGRIERAGLALEGRRRGSPTRLAWWWRVPAG
jgi:hypothetical protein